MEHANRLARLISIPTITKDLKNNKEMEKEFVDTLKDLFPNLFYKSTFNNYNGALLFIVKGSSNNNPIMFMNHYDVVDANRPTIDPFKGIIIDNKLYGRGTLDTKGGLYCMLEAIDKLLKDGFIPKQDIYFLSTNNEETTGESANNISNMFKENNIHFDFILDEGGFVINDPFNVASHDFALIGIGEKDTNSIKFIASYVGGHSSYPDKNQPFVRLAKFINKVSKPSFFKAHLDNSYLYSFKMMSKYSKGIIKLILSHPLFFRPLLTLFLPLLSAKSNAILRTTIAFSKAKGSSNENVLPAKATIVGSLRYSHHEDKEKTIKKLSKVAKKYNISMEDIDENFKSNISSYKNKGFNNLVNAINICYPEAKTIPYIQISASDSKYFTRVSNNVYRFVPFKINDEQLSSIHGKDEYVFIESLNKAIEVYKTLIKGEYHE